jgi:uncharacterized protein DUF6429
MEYDKDKVDDTVLALLWLTTFGEKRFGQVVRRAWKGHDWDALNRLHEKGFIGDPVGKAKSVLVTDEGAKRSEELFRQCFGKQDESRG